MSDVENTTDLQIEEEDLLVSDDLVPTDSQAAGIFYPEQSEAQRLEEGQERATIMGAGDALLEDLMKWFDELIAEAGTIEGVVPNQGASLEGQLLGKIWLRDKATEKKADLLAQWETFTSPKE